VVAVVQINFTPMVTVTTVSTPVHTGGQEDTDRACKQAAAQLASIVEMVAWLTHARECKVAGCREGCTGGDGYANAEEYHDEEAAREFLTDSPLSVEVRTDWHAVGAVEAAKPTHYTILLCWGGPAVQIIGSLDQYNQPDSAALQYQDWFTEWTTFPTTDKDDAALVSYATEFYFDQ
jgi:hypothetical protein